jgi:ketosteroid isomerase-like protein
MFKVHNGEIVTLRDYWNPIDTFEILDCFPELCTMLTQK